MLPDAISNMEHLGFKDKQAQGILEKSPLQDAPSAVHCVYVCQCRICHIRAVTASQRRDCGMVTYLYVSLRSFPPWAESVWNIIWKPGVHMALSWLVCTLENCLPILQLYIYFKFYGCCLSCCLSYSDMSESCFEMHHLLLLCSVLFLKFIQLTVETLSC